MNMLKKPINYQILEKELHDALCADELYKLQNDAKIRAIHQNVPTYDHFKEMVNGAHLKPLENKDKNQKSKTLWNKASACNSNYEYNFNNLEKSTFQRKKDDFNLLKTPKTNEEFLQVWSKLSNSIEKFKYLFNARNILKSKIFGAEVPFTFLSDFIILCHTIISIDNIKDIIELLQILSQCNRFHLNLTFLSKEDKQLYIQLFQNVIAENINEENKNVIKSLASKYDIEIYIPK